MNLLLDTHTFLWLADAPRHLSEPATRTIGDPANVLWLSVASIWEIQIKARTGKLELGSSLSKAIVKQRRRNGVKILPIRLRHVLALDRLPDHHRDPFDRILIAQAVCDRMTLVTCDPQIGRYGVPTLW